MTGAPSPRRVSGQARVRLTPGGVQVGRATILGQVSLARWAMFDALGKRQGAASEFLCTHVEKKKNANHE